MPDVIVEIAFASGYATALASMVWTDVSAYVEAQEAITISRGRSDEFSETQAAELSLVLDNTDGRFTPGHEAGAYWPNVKKGRPIRVSVVHDGVTYRRFLGYINEWPVQWPKGGDEEARVQLTATSRMARVTKAMRSVIEEEYLVPQPLAYYTLGEEAEATVAVDSSGNQTPSLAQTGAGADVVFADSTGPGTDEMSAPTFAAGKYLLASSLFMSTASGLTVAAAFSTAVAAGTVVALSSAGFAAVVNGAGKLAVTLPDGAGTLTSTSTVTNSATWLFVVTIDPTTPAANLYLNGTLEATLAVAPSVAVSTGVRLGEGFAGAISHVGIWDSALAVNDHANMWTAVNTGFAGETPGAAIARFARYGKIPAAEVTADAGSTAALVFISTVGKTPLEAMRLVEGTEYGSLYDGRDGSLVFRGRNHRFNSASALTLSAISQHIGADLSPTLDDQGMMNIVDAARAEDGAPVVHATNQASVDEYGPYAASLALVTASDNEVADAATWRVSRYGEPSIRIPGVSVDVTNLDTTLATEVLTADLGTRFTLADLPAQAPWSSVDLFIEGTTETITHEIHALALTTSTTDLFDSWQLGVVEHGELGRATVLGY